MTSRQPLIHRRTLLKAAALAAAGGTIATSTGMVPRAHAARPVLGTVLDYAAGVPDARAIAAAGHLGAVRYVSRRRPGTENWMLGKPVTAAETLAFRSAGLATASVYQFGRADTADWIPGAAGAAVHAPQAIALHAAAGGPAGRPVYVAIDDNPTRAQYENQIRPYLAAFKLSLEAAWLQLGVYGNYNVIAWALADGLGEFFWQHDWGSGGRLHPRADLHQPAKRTAWISGVQVDVNDVYSQDWGQWTATLPDAVTPGPVEVPVPVPPIPADDPVKALGHLLTQLNGLSS
ncbi:DUF1906 domain-containing protein [Corynebacterium sp. CCM 9185]|uniref:DUF1906 domain-containing protein n=1 Tax=Corynebacterium marambiense TaxID=2765364 RepID=A0ABS0VX51_9CORY|nr:DUF1906 domain-containing protein [Corynebacterium marambiense]MBI8999922.1 DUF1906 domain-containing protein [Corynebacterium marambiense]MCK7663279.1 DUF1906 domain-containing protein [Corynebacterium marambiense]MCX7542333.1 DUF1906 domain-containing protein [Corynebacterium marambiense]